MNNDLDLTADVIDIRDIIARFEELERDGRFEQLEQFGDRAYYEEITKLQNILSELKGKGDDEQWRGAWYPVTLIAESYFQDYAIELANDIEAVNLSEARWPNNHIDWEAAADELKGDYTTTEIGGNTYYYR